MKLLFYRPLLATFLTLTITLSTIAAYLPALVPISTVEAQNAQTTNIFTGQFIPAYLGAAYDPTEAYKMMAGMTVYVFAYDTWGTVVNNFAYQTQVKANGSFQAAGMPNASHYGICLKSNESTDPFRAPREEDGIQSAFAYSQQEVRENLDKDLKTQVKDKPTNLTSIAGIPCRAFLTSTRNVDIANHINVFPVVPTSVLSVIIQDSSIPDFYTQNSPYEIYAQRISTSADDKTTSLNDQLSNCYSQANTTPEELKACIDQYNQDLASTITIQSGPIIRGRSIAYKNENDITVGTIFQAFAPKGTYAITYWRPDNRSTGAKITYLNFDGISSLNTQYNGIAFEDARSDQVFSGVQNKTNWGDLASRPASGENSQSWPAALGTINLWGQVTKSENRIIRPQPYKTISVSSSDIGFYNISERKCYQDGQKFQTTTNIRGIYLLSSACATDNRSPLMEDGDIVTRISVHRDQSDTQEMAAIRVSVNGRQGPAKKNIPLLDYPETGSFGNVTRDGKPFAFANIDLKIGSKIYSSVATADSTGFFHIPQSYFQISPDEPYLLTISPGYLPPNFSSKYQNTLAISHSDVLALAQGKRISYPQIAIDTKPAGKIGTMLANLSLPNLLKSIKINTAYAQNESTYSKDFNDDAGDYLDFDIDLKALGSTIRAFNKANYELRTAELNPPESIAELGTSWENNISTRDSHYEFYNLDKSRNDVLTIGTDRTQDTFENVDNDNELITGVRLRKKNTEVSLYQVFDDYQTDTLNFILRLNFQFRHSDPTQVKDRIDDNQINQLGEEEAKDLLSTGQDESTGYPPVLEASWPITITRQGDGEGSTFTANYDHKVVLDVQSPNCGGGSLLKDGFTGVLKNTLCKFVIAGINVYKSSIRLIANNFLTVDPLSGIGSNIVVGYWNTLRNVVNSLVVIILAIAGIAIMLRYNPKTFQIQHILTKLVIVIVAANFSLLIIQVVIDLVNVVALGGFYLLINSLDSGGNALSSATAAAGALASILMAQLVAAAASGFTGFVALAIVLFGVIALIIYCAYKIMIQYFFRLIVLWICIILMPAAIAAQLLPGTKNLFTKWRNILTGALVAQMSLALVLSLSFSFIANINSATGALQGILIPLISLATLYMATIVPGRASAAFGTNLAGSIQTGAVKGFGRMRGQLFEAREKRRQSRLLTDRIDKKLGIEDQGRLSKTLKRAKYSIDTRVDSFKEAADESFEGVGENFSDARDPGVAGTARAGAAFQSAKGTLKGVGKLAFRGYNTAERALAGVNIEDEEKAEKAFARKLAREDVRQMMDIEGLEQSMLQSEVDKENATIFNSAAYNFFQRTLPDKPQTLEFARALENIPPVQFKGGPINTNREAIMRKLRSTSEGRVSDETLGIIADTLHNITGDEIKDTATLAKVALGVKGSRKEIDQMLLGIGFNQAAIDATAPAKRTDFIQQYIHGLASPATKEHLAELQKDHDRRAGAFHAQGNTSAPQTTSTSSSTTNTSPSASSGQPPIISNPRSSSNSGNTSAPTPQAPPAGWNTTNSGVVTPPTRQTTTPSTSSPSGSGSTSTPPRITPHFTPVAQKTLTDSIGLEAQNISNLPSGVTTNEVNNRIKSFTDFLNSDAGRNILQKRRTFMQNPANHGPGMGSGLDPNENRQFTEFQDNINFLMSTGYLKRRGS